MNYFLMIENEGVAPPESFTVMGASTSRNHSNSNIIGTFGTGGKQAVALLLRNNLSPIIFSSMLRMEFSTKNMSVDDGIGKQNFNRIVIKYSGKTEDGKSKTNTEDLGFVTEMGVHDWTNIEMALREYVSNALDRQLKQKNTWEGANVELVKESQVRAKKGFTRVFVSANEEVLRFFANLGKKFLHFSEPQNLHKIILPKTNRNTSSDGKNAVIYRKGVFVREIQEEGESLFDYNFGNELQIDESRTVNDYSVKNCAAKAIKNADSLTIATILKNAIDGKQHWENTLDSYYLKESNYGSEEAKQRKERWNTAWESVVGETACLTCKTLEIADFVRKKGYNPVVLKSDSWKEAFASYGIKTDMEILTSEEQRGMEVLPPTEDMVKALDIVWGWFEKLGLKTDKQKPALHGFKTITSAGSLTFGYYKDNAVYINQDIGVGLSDMLLSTVLEEVCHFWSNASDLSRDLQELLFRMIVLAMEDKNSLKINIMASNLSSIIKNDTELI